MEIPWESPGFANGDYYELASLVGKIYSETIGIGNIMEYLCSEIMYYHDFSMH